MSWAASKDLAEYLPSPPAPLPEYRERGGLISPLSRYSGRGAGGEGKNRPQIGKLVFHRFWTKTTSERKNEPIQRHAGAGRLVERVGDSPRSPSPPRHAG